MKHIFLQASAVVAIVFGTVTAVASPLHLQTRAHKEQVVAGPEGRTETRLVPAATVVPGDEIVYTITFRNVSDENASGIVITDPVPAEMFYVAGSAFGPGTDIRFSIDGGVNFAAADEITVVDADGNKRRARADEYTHIQWRLRNPLAPGNQGVARFRASLR